MTSYKPNKTNKQQKVLGGKYNVIKTLGTGLFKVKLICDPTTGQQYAAKVCKYSLKKPALEKEANVLREIGKLDIENVIKCIEFIDNTDPTFKKPSEASNMINAPEYNFKAALILELAPNETIFDIIFHNGKLEEKLARTYFKQLVDTVASLHAKSYVHRDLKPENILLDECFRLKLADFGFARDFTEYNQDKMATKLGTESYMAPEMYTAKNYSGVKTDAFSCGVLLFLFLIGRPPFFKAAGNDPFYKNFLSGKPEKFWGIYEEKINGGKEYDAGLKTLISDLLKSNPEERVAVDKLYEYEWMNGEVYSNEELVEVMKPLREAVEEGNKKAKK